MASRTFTIIVGAGAGSRLESEIPKAFCKIGDRTLLALSACAALQVRDLRGLVCVVPSGFRDQALTELCALSSAVNFSAPHLVVEGGSTRNLSVASGIQALIREFSLGADDVVAIHDAARCLVTKEIFESCILAASNSGAASAAAPIRDTLKKVREQSVEPGASLSRDGLYGMQTPQVFRYSILQQGMMAPGSAEATDEVSLVQNICSVTIVKTPFWNFKVTYPEDLATASCLLHSRKPGG